MTGTRIVSLVFLALACLLVFGASHATGNDNLGDPGPMLLPRIVGLCMGVLAVLLFFQKEQLHAPPVEVAENPIIISFSLVAIPLFYLFFEFAGYTIAVGLYLLTAFCLLGHGTSLTTWARYTLGAVAFSLASGLIFTRLLDLPLPGVIP